MNSVKVAPGNRQIPRYCRTGTNNQGINVAKILRHHIHANVDAGLKVNTFLLHEIQAPVQNPFFELEVRNPVSEQTADPVGTLVNSHRVTGAVQLLGAGQTGRPRPDDGNLFAGSCRRRFGFDPTLLKGVLDDLFFNLFNGDRTQASSQGAGQSRPVNSGKLLVSKSRPRASRQRPR